MRCHICDMPLSSPTFNREHDEFDPCGVCLDVIANVFPPTDEDTSDSTDEPDNWAAEDGSDAYNEEWDLLHRDEPEEDTSTGQAFREE